MFSFSRRAAAEPAPAKQNLDAANTLREALGAEWNDSQVHRIEDGEGCELAVVFVDRSTRQGRTLIEREGVHYGEAEFRELPNSDRHVLLVGVWAQAGFAYSWHAAESGRSPSQESEKVDWPTDPVRLAALAEMQNSRFEQRRNPERVRALEEILGDQPEISGKAESPREEMMRMRRGEPAPLSALELDDGTVASWNVRRSGNSIALRIDSESTRLSVDITREAEMMGSYRVLFESGEIHVVTDPPQLDRLIEKIAAAARTTPGGRAA